MGRDGSSASFVGWVVSEACSSFVSAVFVVGHYLRGRQLVY